MLFWKKKNMSDQTTFTKEQVDVLVKDATTQCLNRLVQELDGEKDDPLNRVIVKYKAKIARRAWQLAQKWCKWSNDGPVLMPDYTRIYYRKGNIEVLVSEFPPQVRLVKFRGGLAKRNSSTDTCEHPEKLYNYSLAFPYIIFVHDFINGMHNSTYVCFSDRPLKKLTEQPLRPYLPNLDGTLKLCHGNTFDKSQLIAGNLTQQASYVVSHFWQTAFSDEWSSHYWGCKSHFQTCDPRLATLDAWQSASVENPLFVIEDVQWLPHTEKEFGNMVVKLVLDKDQDDLSLQQDIYTDLVDGLLDEMNKAYSECTSNMEPKIDQIITKILSKADEPSEEEMST
jgi:hypothetical protein